jgi:hypothetical protein
MRVFAVAAAFAAVLAFTAAVPFEERMCCPDKRLAYDPASPEYTNPCCGPRTFF